MSREWRLNPPPNWPMAAGVEVGLDWRPDPTWGPPPVGWQLWHRRRFTGRRTFVPAAFALMLGAVALTGAAGASTGEPAAPVRPVLQRTALFGPGPFPAGPGEGTGAACAASYPGSGQLSDRWVAGGVRPTDC